jgi:hypothetical protein
MVSEIASEISSQPRMSEVSIKPPIGPESNSRPPTKQELEAAGLITRGLNRGKSPEDIMILLLNQKTTEEQRAQPQSDTQPDNKTQPNEQEETGRKDNQINKGEDGDNRRSGQDREGGDVDSNEEKTSNEPNKPEQEIEIRELKKQIEALTQEIKGLREALKELEAQAGKIVEDLKKILK